MGNRVDAVMRALTFRQCGFGASSAQCHLNIFMSKSTLFNLPSFSVFRFLRHVPVIYVDYPGPTSLTQIYGTFNRAMLRIVPPLRSYAQPLTDAMVEFYSMSQVG